MEKRKRMTVRRIDSDGDRLFLCEWAKNPGDPNEYRVIASLTCPVQKGDVIEYEPWGKNFGWFHSVVQVNKE